MLLLSLLLARREFKKKGILNAKQIRMVRESGLFGVDIRTGLLGQEANMQVHGFVLPV